MMCFLILWMDSHFVKLICFLKVAFEEQITKLKIIRCLHTEANTLPLQVEKQHIPKPEGCKFDESCFFLCFSPKCPGEISAKLFISGFAEKYRASGRNIEKKTPSQQTSWTPLEGQE